ncbi:MAG: hypothetical protein IT442_07360, partial [Phycisphaeraceae bacterium]|nr:hypothetical protein [Phycisphaeraceae bacterium]
PASTDSPGHRAGTSGGEAERIGPWPTRPDYWQYQGRPVLLLGGSVEDNLFQISHLREHLDLLAKCGGNYIRCTMSSRDPGDVWPFHLDSATGKYNLDRFGEEFWRRFELCLDLCQERGIVLQIEVWDRFDFAREPWLANPFNPANNVNYTTEQSGLRERIDTHPGQRESAFFRSVPALESNELLLRYQRALVDRMLAVTLPRPNVLYCMDNETNESPLWGAYWAGYIADKARRAGVSVHLTEMWDAHDLLSPQHEATWKHPEVYSFIDVSQNNHQQGQKHWDNLLAFRRLIAETGRRRPINCVKTYGAHTGRYGNDRDGIERFWRSILGGCASSRFHRPTSGLGLSDTAQACLRSARMMLAEIDIFASEPHNDLLGQRSANEAYCRAIPGSGYVVFFTDGGDVTLQLPASVASAHVRWLDILASRWQDMQAMTVDAEHRVRLVTPVSSGYWVAAVKPQG